MSNSETILESDIRTAQNIKNQLNTNLLEQAYSTFVQQLALDTVENPDMTEYSLHIPDVHLFNKELIGSFLSSKSPSLHWRTEVDTLFICRHAPVKTTFVLPKIPFFEIIVGGSLMVTASALSYVVYKIINEDNRIIEQLTKAVSALNFIGLQLVDIDGQLYGIRYRV